MSAKSAIDIFMVRPDDAAILDRFVYIGYLLCASLFFEFKCVLVSVCLVVTDQQAFEVHRIIFNKIIDLAVSSQ